MQYVLFLIEEQQFGLDLFLIERVLNIVEVTPLPNAPPHLLGAIDLHGEVVPVLNLRHILGFQKKEIALSDHLLICRFQNTSVALWVDQVSRITDSPARQCTENQVGSKMKGIKQIIEENNQLIFIIDINHLLPNDAELSAILRV